MTQHIIDKTELRRRIPYSDTQIWRLEKAGLFPKRVKLGSNRVAWVAAEIDEWIAEHVARRDGGSPDHDRPAAA